MEKYSIFEPFIQNKIAEFSKEISELCGQSYVFEAKHPEPVTPELVMENVCKMLKVNKDEVMGRSRRRPVIDAGFICSVLIRDMGYGCKATGVHVKHKPLDHASVLARWRQHENLLKTDRAYRNKYELCKSII